jgi:aerobic-type carbon monoxide dehydrogenase small subunit (CoxS/CutS family)
MRPRAPHVGCDTSYCGAHVFLDGRAVKSCTAAGCAGCGGKITTVEGLERAGLASAADGIRQNHALHGFCAGLSDVGGAKVRKSE